MVIWLHMFTHTYKRRLVSAHLLCVTECVCVYVDDITLHRHWAKQDFSWSCAVCLVGGSGCSELRLN